MRKQESNNDIERGSPGPKARIQRLQRKYYGIPRVIRILLIAAIVFVVGKDLAIRIQGDFDYKLKILPTDFEALTQKATGDLWLPQQPVRHVNGTNIDDRYVFMRHLGTGNEGSASQYVDISTGEVVVVKTWTGPLKNIRNHLPGTLAPAFRNIHG